MPFETKHSSKKKIGSRLMVRPTSFSEDCHGYEIKRLEDIL